MRVLCLLVIALLAGCGQKGPLYFAPKEPAKAAPPAKESPLPAPADTQNQKNDKDQDHDDQAD